MHGEKALVGIPPEAGEQGGRRGRGRRPGGELRRRNIRSASSRFVPFLTFPNTHTHTHTYRFLVLSQVTCVEWNATGAILLASFGLRNNTGWCNSKGAVAAWNLSSRSFDPRKPSVNIEHSSHIMCMAAHPVKPAVFVAGSFNGEVLVYDTSLPSPLQAASKIDDYFHREPNSSLSFVASPQDARSYVLVSTSGDGKVLYWDIDKLKAPIRGKSNADVYTSVHHHNVARSLTLR